jgi:riboflavin synthase
VDGQGTVTGIERLEGSWRLELVWQEPAWGRYVCEKASVAVDGISLTVAGCDEGGARFWIAVIPHTWAGTTLAQRRLGDRVNLEADLLAKYTERLLEARGALARPPAGGGAASEPPLDASWLADHGWI